MLKYVLAGAKAVKRVNGGARDVWSTYGPKVSAVGVLLVTVGMVLQGRFEEVSHTDIELALLALGLLGTRANKVSSERAGAK